MKRLLCVAIALMIAGCQDAPVVSSSPTPSPRATINVGEAAAFAGLDAGALVQVGDGVYAARLVEPTLQLIQLTTSGSGSWEITVLAEAPSIASMTEAAPDRTEYFATCHSAAEVAVRHFIFGEASEHRELLLEGLASIGGSVINGTYAIAITQPLPGTGTWDLLGDSESLSSGTTEVFPPQPSSGCVLH